MPAGALVAMVKTSKFKEQKLGMLELYNCTKNVLQTSKFFLLMKMGMIRENLHNLDLKQYFLR